jgi:hypothetical protein
MGDGKNSDHLPVRRRGDGRASIPLAAGSALLVLASLVHAQTEKPLRGIIVDQSGKAINQATVYGSVSKTCCPFRREATKTNAEGEFVLQSPGAVVHMWGEGFEPQSIIVSPESANLRVALKPAGNDLTMPNCAKRNMGERDIPKKGWNGMTFRVKSKGVKVLGGKWDVDYVRYIVRRKSGKAALELWFGPYAFQYTPDDELFLNSATFDQRNLVRPEWGVVGRDSWGQLKTGGRWRSTGGMGSGARYWEASPEDARVFDEIIDSICWTPYPKK